MARGVPLRFFRESSSQISNRKGASIRFVRELFHQIPNRKGCPPKMFQRDQGVSPKDFSENPVPKSQISSSVTLRFFRESSPASNRKGFPPKMFREAFPQISNRKGCPAEIFQKSPPPKSQIAKGVPLSLARGVPLSFFQTIKSTNLELQAVSP